MDINLETTSRESILLFAPAVYLFNDCVIPKSRPAKTVYRIKDNEIIPNESIPYIFIRKGVAR